VKSCCRQYPGGSEVLRLPFRSFAPPERLRSAVSGATAAGRGAAAVPFSAGAAQRAKVAAGSWAKAGIEDPGIDSASPFGPDSRPFSALRTQDPQAFNNWFSQFTKTDMGNLFQPPPPEPPPAGLAPAPGPDAATGGAPLKEEAP